MNKTQWKVYSTTEDAWKAMLEACKNAKKSIDLEQFLFVADDVGKQFIEVCAAKAQEGVRVRFLWDAAGSFTFFGSSLANDLKKKGIELAFFYTLVPRLLDLHDYRFWFFRNHRRSLIIDDEKAFTGSICLSDKMKEWRDTHTELSGDIVIEIRKAFEAMWNRAHGIKSNWSGRELISSDGFNYVTNNPSPRRRFLYYRLIDAIRNGQKYIYITTPYFVPTQRLLRVILLAAHRGADVRLILPKGSDHPLVDLCARSFFSQLLKAGVRIFLYNGEMIHNKTIVIDDEWGTAGSLNLDNISLLYNYEANIITTDHDCIQEFKNHFAHDQNQSTELLYSEWKKRIFLKKVLERLSRLISKFL
ncbi:MAG: phospholipase D-like domain-containing protein [Patescibacteria group bacterium]